MELGSWSDLVAGIGGFAAAVAAFVAWRVNKRMLDVEQRRDDATQARLACQQANEVYVLGANLTNRTAEEEWGMLLVNNSSKPVVDVEIRTRHLRTGQENYPLKLSMLPPGQYAVPSHPKYHWGSLVDLSKSPEPINLLVKAKLSMITAVTFTDGAGSRWHLKEGVHLTPNLTSPVLAAPPAVDPVAAAQP